MPTPEPSRRPKHRAPPVLARPSTARGGNFALAIRDQNAARKAFKNLGEILAEALYDRLSKGEGITLSER